MTISGSGLDEHRHKSADQGGLEEVIQLHMSARRKIDRTIDRFPDDTVLDSEMRWLDGGLEEAVEDEESARLAFLDYRVTSLEDVRAKADHVRLLLDEGDEFDKAELQMLLLSMS